MHDVAVIVGGGPGISASCARLFAQNGMRVGIAARNPDKPVLQSLESIHGVRRYACDASEPAAVAMLFQNVVRDLGVPTLVVHNIDKHKSAVHNFYDEDELRRVYYPEAERLVAKVTGATRVLVFDHTVRRRIRGGVDRSAGTPRQPVTVVHNDYTIKSGPQRVRDLMGEEAQELLSHRLEIVNVWRPIRGPLRDAPLAVCDATTVAFTDFVPSDLVYRDRTGEIYRVRYNAAHHWFYVPEMQVDEAILIKCYDSAPEKARFTAHSAFEDPTAPADVPPRESIELRTLVFHA